MRKLLIVIVVVFMTACADLGVNPLAANGTTAAPATNATAKIASLSVTPATSFNNFFTRYGAGEWTGGDVTYSIPLPDGRHLWCFGDSFLGPVNADRTRPVASQPLLFGNVFLTQNLDGTATSIYGNDSGFPVAYLRPATSGEYYWPKHGLYYNNKVYIFLYHWKPTGGGAFGIQFLGTKLAVLNYPSLTISSVIDMNKGTSILFGSSVMLEGSTLYIYGSEDLGTTKYMHLAKVAIGSITNGNAWQHFKGGSTWSTGVTGSARLLNDSATQFTNNANEYTVLKSGTTYYLFNQEPTNFSNNIHRYKSTSPQGPWGSKLLIYQTPYYGSGTWTYDAKVHPAFKNGSASSTDLLMSYDLNVDPISNSYSNADLYRPYFVWVSGWQ